ncbi:hypothetical protein AB1N83_009139 [Pleurotus pulmonarius]
MIKVFEVISHAHGHVTHNHLSSAWPQLATLSSLSNISGSLKYAPQTELNIEVPDVWVTRRNFALNTQIDAADGEFYRTRSRLVSVGEATETREHKFLLQEFSLGPGPGTPRALLVIDLVDPRSIASIVERNILRPYRRFKTNHCFVHAHLLSNPAITNGVEAQSISSPHQVPSLLKGIHGPAILTSLPFPLLYQHALFTRTASYVGQQSTSIGNRGNIEP